MTIVNVNCGAVVKACNFMAEAILFAGNKKSITHDQGIKLDTIRELAECSKSETMEIDHEHLILFIEYLPKTQTIKTENDNS